MPSPLVSLLLSSPRDKLLDIYPGLLDTSSRSPVKFTSKEEKLEDAFSLPVTLDVHRRRPSCMRIYVCAYVYVSTRSTNVCRSGVDDQIGD